MRIALDAMGGDLAPKAVIDGAVMAARDLNLDIVLVGDRELIASGLSAHQTSGLLLSIEHAGEAVRMEDSPLESVLDKPDSSILVGLELVKHGGAEAFVSAGNSGAVMAASMAILGTLPGVDRPAIASVVPTTGGPALLIDAGANTEVKPLNLMQFGVMGSVYWERVRNVARPRVGILSNGEEPSKGTDLTRAAAAALTQMSPHVNYIGYVEGRDINRLRADVVVTDGFTGNVALKTMEGVAVLIRGNFYEVFGQGLMPRIAYFMVRGRLRALREQLDPAEYGGAPLLGINGTVIIAHGSSNARAIRNAVRAAANQTLVHHVNTQIVDILAHGPPLVSAKRPAGKGIRGLLLRMRGHFRMHRETTPGERAEQVEDDHLRPEPSKDHLAAPARDGQAKVSIANPAQNSRKRAETADGASPPGGSPNSGDPRSKSQQATASPAATPPAEGDAHKDRRS